MKFFLQMLKHIIFLFLLSLYIEKTYAVSDLRPTPAQAKELLRNVNLDYMKLMLGITKGIRHEKGTDPQLRQMVDGCITVGITDRLFGFTDQIIPLISRTNDFTGNKKIHVQLAYALYALGFYNRGTIVELKEGLSRVGITCDPTFDKEFNTLCSLVFDCKKGTVFDYKNSLEDSIRRTAVPLKFADFPAPSPLAASAPAAAAAELVERYYTDNELAVSGKPTDIIDAYKIARNAKRPAKLARFGAGLSAKYEGEVESVALAMAASAPAAVASVAAVAGQVERYYTDTEIDDLSQPFLGMYRRKKAEGMSPRDIRGVIKKMNKDIPAKYGNEVGVAPASAAPAAKPSFLSGIAGFGGGFKNKGVKTKGDEPAAAAPASAPAANPMILALQKRMQEMQGRLAANRNKSGSDSD